MLNKVNAMKKIQTLIKTLKASPLPARIGLIVIVFGLAVALFAPILAPYGESEALSEVWLPPGGDHLLGTDQLGRDMLSRLIYGARNSITIAFICKFNIHSPYRNSIRYKQRLVCINST